MIRRLPRRLSLVYVALVAAVTSVALAMPASAATEGEEAVAASFGTGQWDGVLLGVVLGFLAAVAFFFDADPGGIPGPDDHDH